jgi:hypothetical protein
LSQLLKISLGSPEGAKTAVEQNEGHNEGQAQAYRELVAGQLKQPDFTWKAPFANGSVGGSRE